MTRSGTRREKLLLTPEALLGLQLLRKALAGAASPAEAGKRLNLARHLRLGYHGSWWTDRERRLLGKLPDTEVARRIGRTPTAVRIKREALAIANAPVRWSITYCGELWAAQQGSEANYGYARDVDRRWSTNFFPTG